MKDFKPPQQFTGTLTPGEVKKITGPNVFVRILETNGDIKIGFDLGQTFLTKTGLGYQCLPGQFFEEITLENATAADVTYTVLVGQMRFFDDRLNVVTASNYLPVTEPPSALVGAGVTAIAAGADVSLTGVAGAGQYRRAGVLVDNLDAASPLTIYDAAVAGNVAGYVLPGSSRYIPLSGPCRIANDTGAPINCAVAEIWQLSP